MIFNRISLFFFGLAFASMACIFMHWSPLGISKINLTYFGLIGAGGLGYLFSILSIWLDKGRTNKRLNNHPIFYVGGFLVVIGVIFKLMHWPMATIIMLLGILTAGLSYFLPRKEKNSKPEESDLLDS